MPRSTTSARADCSFYLHPGSGLARKGRKWILAAELTETTRLFARCAAKIEPEWIEAVAGDRVTRDYFEPHWEERRGEVVASERVQLYGLTLVARRPVSFGRDRSRGRARRVHPRGARAGRVAHARRVPRAQPCAGRRSRRARAQGAPAGRARRRRDDRRVSTRERIPANVHSTAAFERWRADAERKAPRLSVPHARRSHASCRGSGHRRALSRDARAGGHAAAAQVPVHARTIRSTASR